MVVCSVAGYFETKSVYVVKSALSSDMSVLY